MEREEISRLLEKYWEGETSLEEDNKLKQFFKSEKTSEEWPKEQAYFQYLEEQKITSGIDDDEILSHLENDNKKPAKQVNMWLTNMVKVAAVFLIIAAAVFFVREDYQTKKEKMDPVITDTFEDPQKAFEETKKALLLVSNQFNKGRKHAAKLSSFDDATEKVENLERDL